MMYAMGIDLWPGKFPHIPGPSDWLKSLASMFFNSQVGMLKFSMHLIFNTSDTTVLVLQSDEFSFQLGGSVHLSIHLLSLVILLVGFYTLLKMSDERALTWGRLLRSFGVLAGFAIGFYPAVQFIYGMWNTLFSLLTTYFTKGDPDQLQHALTTLASPTDVIGLFFGAMIGWVITFFVAWICLALLVITLGVTFLYPVLAVLSPIGKVNGFFASAFHAANAALVTVIVSPVLMVLWLAIAVAAIKKADEKLFVGSGYAGMAIEDVALLFVIATPFAVSWMAYQTSIQVWGRTDTMLRNTVDIRNSRPLTFEEVQNRVANGRSSWLTRTASTALVSAIDDVPKEPMKRRIVDTASKLALRSGNMEVAAVLEAVKRTMPSQPRPKRPSP